MAAAGRRRRKRHVWVKEGDLLRAIEVTIGINDGKFSELVEGKVEPGQKLVSGLKEK